MRRARWKRKNVRDELTVEAANSPIRRSSRYGLPPKSGNLLPAALKVRKEPSASPHLEAGHLPGCKPERLSATVPCVPLRYALPGATCERQRKEGQRVSCLEHRYAADFLVSAPSSSAAAISPSMPLRPALPVQEGLRTPRPKINNTRPATKKHNYFYR